MAYPFAAFVVGYLAERGFDRRYLTSVVAMLVGLAVVYACGVLWLGTVRPHRHQATPRSGCAPPFIDRGRCPSCSADVDEAAARRRRSSRPLANRRTSADRTL